MVLGCPVLRWTTSLLLVKRRDIRKTQKHPHCAPSLYPSSMATLFLVQPIRYTRSYLLRPSHHGPNSPHNMRARHRPSMVLYPAMLTYLRSQCTNTRGNVNGLLHLFPPPRDQCHRMTRLPRMHNLNPRNVLLHQTALF